MVEALGNAGGAAPNVVILPQASEAEDRGQKEKQAFEAMGIQSVTILEELDNESAIALLDGANVIWFADGSPSRLMRELSAHAVASRFTRWRMQGAIVGGAGAVAGVLGVTFLEGPIDPPPMVHLSVKPIRGLGLWPGLVVTKILEDNRLAQAASAVFDQVRLVALCLDAGAAVRILNDDMYMLGSGPTLVIDARKAKKTWIDKDSTHSVRNAQFHSFARGEVYNWFE